MEDNLKTKYSENDLPSSSVASKTHKPDIRTKTPKRWECLAGEAFNDAKDYVVHDIILPAIRDLVYDTIGGVLYGSASRNRSVARPTSNTQYSTYYSMRNSRRYPSPGYDDRDIIYAAKARRSKTSYNDIIFNNRVEADEVLDVLLYNIEKYGRVSVADLLNECGIEPDYTDHDFGWDALGTARVARTRDGGYYLVLPKPISIK